jgi:hypothetical protein
MVLTTHRTDYKVPWADSPYYTQIALDGLAAHEIEEMLTALLGGGRYPAELLRFIQEKSDGNPLFIEEITRRWSNADSSSGTTEECAWILVRSLSGPRASRTSSRRASTDWTKR